METRQTFAQLGIPLPLFEAPAGESPDYLGLEQCSLCGSHGVHCFSVDDLIASCPQCRFKNAVNTRCQSSVCKSCSHEVPSPASRRDPAVACYRCLQAGRAAFAKDTVLGMVTWDQAVEGLTHGIPGLKSADFEVVPAEDDPEWMRAVVPSHLLLELVRTPSYVTWQGEQWQFCCGKPMVYVGEWQEAEFNRHAPDGDGRALLKNASINGVDESSWGDLQNIGGPYMFRCKECASLRGHYDMD